MSKSIDIGKKASKDPTKKKEIGNGKNKVYNIIEESKNSRKMKNTEYKQIITKK